MHIWGMDYIPGKDPDAHRQQRRRFGIFLITQETFMTKFISWFCIVHAAIAGHLVDQASAGPPSGSIQCWLPYSGSASADPFIGSS